MFKKVVLSLFAVFCFFVKSEARNFEVWRTSITNAPVSNLSVTTASAYINKIEVLQSGYGSMFTVKGGTWIGNISSTRTYDTSTSGKYYYPLMPYPTGFILTVVGTATVEAYWEYMFQSPKGQESKGLDNR